MASPYSAKGLKPIFSAAAFRAVEGVAVHSDNAGPAAAWVIGREKDPSSVPPLGALPALALEADLEISDRPAGAERAGAHGIAEDLDLEI